jgi:tetratricopeptide (TPR) repeat protein
VAGRPIGPASDQFSFCASLFEACYGTRPFRGDSYRDLAKNILSGSIVETRGAGVPRWLAQVIRRGLSTDPDGRWPDMHALARALRHRGGRHGRRWAAAAVGAGVLAAWVWMDAGQQPHCDPAAGGIDSATAWARIETGVHQANVPYGSETLSRIQPHLEEHATRFAESWREACTADVAEEEVEARVGCLEQRREDFDLLVRGLAEATPKAVERATSDVHRLEDPRNCLDPSLRVSNDLDETGSSEEQSLRNHLSQASALRRAGDYEASLDTANAVLERAEALGSDALVARAAYNVGLTLKSTERREEARDAMELAYHRAVATGSDRIAANAAMQLTNLTVKASDFDEAQRWITYAKSALSRIGDPPREYSTLLDNEARMLDRMGRYDEAARVFERALVAREEAYGPNSNAMAYTLDHYGSTLSALGRYDDSFAKHSAALEILEELHGPNHPEVGRTLGNYGHILSRRGKRDEAIEAYDRSLAILRAAYGEDNSVLGALLSGRGSAYLAKGDIEHARADLKLALQIESAHTDGQDASTGIAHNNLGNVELIDRNYDEAEYHFRRAYELYASSWGTEHAYATGTFLNLARVAGAKGDHELAVQRYQEGLERLQATLPAGHITIGGAHNNLAGQLVEVGRLDEARDHFEKAKAIMTEQMLATDGRIAFPEQGLANIDLLRGDFESAIDRLTWVLDLWEQHGPPDEHQLAVARIMMAEALQGAGREPERVHSLAETATEHFAEHPDPDRLDKAKRLSR